MGIKSSDESSTAESNSSSAAEPSSSSESTKSAATSTRSKGDGDDGDKDNEPKSNSVSTKKGQEDLEEEETKAQEGKEEEAEVKSIASSKLMGFFGKHETKDEEDEVEAAEEEPKEGLPESTSVEESLADLGRTTSGRSIEQVVADHHPDPQISNEKWHEYFPLIPEDDNLIEDYRCALQREILVQGRVFISENHISFRGSVFGYDINLHIPWTEVLTIEKTRTALVIPNALELKTLNSKHVFSSLMSRDAAYALAVAVWRHSHPETPRMRDRSDSESTLGSTLTLDKDGNEVSYTDDEGGQRHFKFKDKAKQSGLKNTFVADDDEKAEGKGEAEEKGGPKHPPTEYDGEMYSHEAGDFMIPASPEQVYKLMFRDEDFLRPFWEENQKLHDIEVGEWRDDDEGRPSRGLSFIKPLHGPIGPKETLCLIVDTVDEMDPDKFIAVRTTTHTPNVPSGSTFFVKSRTVLTWNEEGETRVQLSTEVEWTKPNWALKGIIERSCLDGQKTYATEIKGALLDYLTNTSVEDSDAKISNLESGYAAKTDSKTSSKSKEDLLPLPATTSTSSASPSLPSLLLSYLPPLLPSLVILLLLLLLTNYFTLISLRTQARRAHAVAQSARMGSPEGVSEGVQRVLEEFKEAYAVGAPTSREEGEREWEEMRKIVKRARGDLGKVEERLERLGRAQR